MSLFYQGRNLVLAGLMGAGKSAVGAILGRRLDRPLVDTDVRVEQWVGESIAEIFAGRGEREFRRLESEVIRGVSSVRGQVVAVGGGAVVDPSNVTALHATGDIVWLDADAATLAERVGRDGVNARPLLADGHDLAGELEQLRATRAQAYRDAAAHRVDTSALDPDAVADAVLAWALTHAGLLTDDERRQVRAGGGSSR